MDDFDAAARLRADIDRYLRDCYARVSPPRVGELAEVLGLHPVAVRRRAQALLGETVSHAIKIGQLRFACELLHGSTLTVAEIAARAAFGSRRSFLRSFRHCLGVTPAAYRSTKVSLDTAAP
jgi:AraC-like DNA-binding protein